MTRLVHLTDLHFGLERADLVAPLADAIRSCRPDVVVASGDLTQRALRGQFRRAMGYLRGLEAPFLVVPGNHDLPVYNPLARLLTPFRAFRTCASRDLAPRLAVGRLRLFSMNTADPFQWRGGVARTSEIDRVCQALGDGPADATNVLVCHHPLVDPPGFERGETKGAADAMARLARAGVHAVLSGHLHHWTTGLAMPGQVQNAVFLMQTGTALCARKGERDHGFAVMDFERDRLSVTPWIVEDATARFAPRPRSDHVFRDGGWRAAD